MSCGAVIWHGPGHQSYTRCQVKGKHKLHEAVYGPRKLLAEWYKSEAYTDPFDNPPYLNDNEARG